MITFIIDDQEEHMLRIWRNEIRNDPRVKNKPEKFVFYALEKEIICEVTRGPHKIDLSGIEEEDE